MNTVAEPMMPVLPRMPRRVPVSVAVAAAMLLLLSLLLAWHPVQHRSEPRSRPLDHEAGRFVTLALTLGRIRPDEVDGYFGPADLRPSSTLPPPSLDAISRDLGTLAHDVDGVAGADERRKSRLKNRIVHLRALVDILRSPERTSFDDEARRVYGMSDLTVDQAALHSARARLEELLPGPGALAMRVDAFRAHYVVPPDRRRAVFARALAACRRRTLAHWALPAGERVAVEWTSSVDAAWATYLGGYRTLLRINPDAVAFLGSALDVACHEALPGHHAQFVLQEAATGAAGLPLEDTIVLLRSPDSLLREGAANYGVDLAFPTADRLAFERDVMFPMAGFPPTEAARFEEIRAAIDRLAPATVPILRDYRDGTLSTQDAAAALRRDAAISSPQALLAFVDALGPYGLGYTIAREQVRQTVERHTDVSARWATLGRIVSGPAWPVTR